MPQKPRKDEAGYVSPYREKQIRLAQSGLGKIKRSQALNEREWDRVDQAKKFNSELRKRRGL